MNFQYDGKWITQDGSIAIVHERRGRTIEGPITNLVFEVDENGKCLTAPELNLIELIRDTDSPGYER